MMKKSTLVLLAILALAVCSNANRVSDMLSRIDQKKGVEAEGTVMDSNEQCNITHFEFQSNVSLGKNDELNRTFAKIGEKLTQINSVNWIVNETAAYTISNVDPVFYYRDSKQKAEIVGNDTILIDGGYLEVDLTFNWTRSGGTVKRSGTGKVMGLSDEVIFAKGIVIDGDFFKYELLDYINVTFDNPMSWVRIDPPETPAEDRDNLLKLVNNVPNVTTVRHELEDDIALYYPLYLSANLHDESSPIDEHFEYKWEDPVHSRGNLVIEFTRRPSFIDIEPDGIHYGFEAKIDGFNESKCGEMPPILPLNPKVYGGSQEFVSYTFYENVIRYAIIKGHMNSPLSKDLWESRMFQFYAGDLYEIFPKVAETFSASVEVSGNCKASPDKLMIYQSTVHTFNVSLHSDCEINVNRTKILDFSVGLELEVEGKVKHMETEFKLRGHEEHVTFSEYDGWKMQNEELAREMVHHSLNRLYEGKLFGSGFLTHPKRNYPHFEAEVHSTVIYDSTHVDLSFM